MKFRASSESGKSEATHTAPDPSMPDRPIYPATIFFTYAANVAIAAVVGYAALAILGRAGDAHERAGSDDRPDGRRQRVQQLADREEHYEQPVAAAGRVRSVASAVVFGC